jgi:hypothetical protein
MPAIVVAAVTAFSQVFGGENRQAGAVNIEVGGGERFLGGIFLCGEFRDALLADARFLPLLRRNLRQEGGRNA